MKVLSLFSGIGAFEKALDNLNVNYELVNYCEIDKYASKSYATIHGVSEEMNLGDITKVDEKALPKDVDLITYGFPCQDISLAGKQKGLFNEDGSQTRSGLFFEALRIIEGTKPRVAIAENVKNLTSKKFSEQFKIVLNSLEQAGYNNYWQVLNAKDYGIPQNRERVFIISIRKDIDNGTFKFPEGFPLELRLKDMLDDVVDEKYYLSEKALEGIKNSNFVQKQKQLQTTDVCRKLLSRNYKDPKVMQIGNCMPTKTRDNPNQGRVYDADGISPALNTAQGGNLQPMIIVGDESVSVREATKKGYTEAYEGDSINLEYPNSTTRRGRVGHQVAQTLTTSSNQGVVVNLKRGYPVEVQPEQDDTNEIDIIGNYSKSNYNATPIVGKNGIAPTVRENHGQVTAIVESDEPRVLGGIGEKKSNGGTQWYQQDRIYDNNVGISVTTSFHPYYVDKQLRIRKLTPKEYFRLMGFDDEDFAKAEEQNSNTQLYKQAGNSIVVPVVERIINALLECGALEKEI